MRRPINRLLAALVATAMLGGCSLAPTYHAPNLPPMPSSFKEGDTAWKVATPTDQQPHGSWWTVYGDDSLNGLETKLDADNPSLAAALARYDQARAYETQLSAGLFPHIGAMANPVRARQSNNRPLRGSNQPNEYDSDTVGIEADFDLDLWGRIRNEVSAGRALAQASQADLAAAKLSLEAQLADNYVRLRGYDIQVHILQDALSAYQRALQLTENRHNGGVASGMDVSRAQAQLDDAQAQVTDVLAQRALTEHAIAALVGEPASSFSVAVEQNQLKVPPTPVGVPSTLLERRPDIAAAERRVFAANADIGVARAAFFPDLSLSGNFGFQDTGMGSLLSVGNRFWAVGPLATLNIFDAGLRRAQLGEAHAVFDETSANYRQIVLVAFRQVEDDLALLQQLGIEARQEDQAYAAAQQTLNIATNRYREGIVNYLEVVTAQTAALSAQRNAETIRTRRLQASVDLIRALGGGWMRDNDGMDGVVATENKTSEKTQIR
ncbi:efflux transporter outer membrane subunit [Dyella nitratireducens]|uniref:Outer membrane efflux lipoprotein n=1 Tax=Dyella nitratireducens TaxID=1849580 RepID=A0ABQ1FPX5_9GAMM|nr:efflux transporter outer membrane subunit [Dyella nitratireducens]GGA25762.1 outer membrane efflux lipoprotein [Dyella nitratireducens]GLQ43640.1 outer membrane efflux lipoprotein [Dyella nitratireducens]